MPESVLSAEAPAKLNLALVVGPLRDDGRHEVVTVLQRLDFADEVEVRRAETVAVTGFEDDAIVAAALELLRSETGAALAASIEKRIPVAAGLGGGSSDAAAALGLGNTLLGEPVSGARLHELAATLGADVPFFLSPGPQLGTGVGSTLAPLVLPQDYSVLLALPLLEVKDSTAEVYRRFDMRDGADGFEQRRAELLGAVSALSDVRSLAALPPNDLARSALADELRALGAFRADVTGAGPTVYGLFDDDEQAAAAAAAVAGRRAHLGHQASLVARRWQAGHVAPELEELVVSDVDAWRGWLERAPCGPDRRATRPRQEGHHRADQPELRPGARGGALPGMDRRSDEAPR